MGFPLCFVFAEWAVEGGVGVAVLLIAVVVFRVVVCLFVVFVVLVLRCCFIVQ